MKLSTPCAPESGGRPKFPMPSSPALRRVGWANVAEPQGGIIGRNQLLDLDLTPAQEKSDINNWRWRRLLPGGEIRASRGRNNSVGVEASSSRARRAAILTTRRKIDDGPDHPRRSAGRERRFWQRIHNARDLGGLPAGSVVTSFGRFYRAHRLESLTAHGWAELVTAGVRTVIDLRNPTEVSPRMRRRGHQSNLPSGVPRREVNCSRCWQGSIRWGT
jgi:hypothetical protein